MLNPSRRGMVVRSIALVAGGLVCTALALPSSLHAQAEGAAVSNRLRVRLAATGTRDFLATYAHVSVSEPAYVTVFEIHPDVGALMVYPVTNPRRQRLQRAVSFDLTDLVLDQYRREFRRLSFARFTYASRVRTRGYLVAIASRRPLNTSLLASGRILEYPGGAAEPYDIVDELVSLLVPAQPAGDWSYDIYGFFNDQEPALAYLMAPGYFYPERSLYGYPGSFCYGSGFAFYFGLYPGAFYGRCGARAYDWFSWYGPGLAYGGWPWGWGYGHGWGYGPSFPRGQPRTAGPVDTQGMTPGTPRDRDRHIVVDGGPGSAVVAGRVAEGRHQRKGVTDSGKKSSARSPDPVDAAERFREILDQLGDARSTEAIGPAFVVQNEAAFARAGLRATPLLGYRMRAQALEAQNRLEHRLQSMGVPAGQAMQAAGRAGGAPRIGFRGQAGATVIRRSAPPPASAGSGGAAAHRPSAVRGARRVQRVHVSRPASPRPRAVSRPAPRAPRPHGGGSSHGGGHGQL